MVEPDGDAYAVERGAWLLKVFEQRAARAFTRRRRSPRR
jgi:hypothetical protein